MINNTYSFLGVIFDKVIYLSSGESIFLYDEPNEFFERVLREKRRLEYLTHLHAQNKDKKILRELKKQNQLVKDLELKRKLKMSVYVDQVSDYLLKAPDGLVMEKQSLTEFLKREPLAPALLSAIAKKAASQKKTCFVVILSREEWAHTSDSMFFRARHLSIRGRQIMEEISCKDLGSQPSVEF